MSKSADFLAAVENRRTIYSLTNEPVIADENIRKIIETAILNAPSSFNSQSSRVVLLLRKDHEKLWDITSEILKPIVPPEMWAWTEEKVAAFRAAYGTILFLEDTRPVNKLEEQYPAFAHHFPTWSEHASAMLQFILWTALELEGFGASLQHYNPLIDARVASEWGLPAEWQLKSQLVFGKPSGEPDKKTFEPLEDRFKVYGL
ncbi:hypothetical protein VTL71DRAFT_6870 [Oculimacula yallundae]|uniref:Nitroreductase domain-containing protein n=1 Tax=Oculimacula yallundae TaxID=86028 RepID=A0ABR4BXN4_9HELO